MRTFVISILMVSVIAINAETPLKKLEKRGILGGHGYASGGLASGGAIHGSVGAANNGNYLPPVPSVSVVKKPYPVPLPAPTYGVPPSYAHPAPAPAYGVPTLSVGPAYVTSVVPSAPTVGTHVQVPVYSGHLVAPAPTYGVPSYASSPSYAVSAPVATVGSVGSVGLGTGSLSSSYGVPNTVVNTVPSAGVSFGTVNYPSKSYGVPSTVGVDSGFSAGHFGVHGKSYSAPQVVHGGHSSDLSISLPGTSYGVPSHGVPVGQDDGYSYPAPSNKLLV